jgi:SAM-dependent methyltransferase
VKATAISRGEVKRVLVRFPNWLGDTVMAVPTLRALRGALPGAELWCLGPWVRSLLEAEPGIARRLAAPRGVGARLAQARRLRQARFDVALVLPSSFETALAGWLSGARWRVGYGEGRSALLTHAIPEPSGWVHQVAAYLALLAPFGMDVPPAPPTLLVDPARRAEARRLLDETGMPLGAPRVGLQLGAALGPAKLWPSARILNYVQWLVTRHAAFAGSAEAAFKAMFRALKPGGILGVVEHRANPTVPQDPKAASGYVREDVVIKFAEDAGFKLAGKSEINANPKDTKDYPQGVWTLPPVLRLKDVDKEKYLAIGESDRMTLKFTKPATK